MLFGGATTSDPSTVVVTLLMAQDGRMSGLDNSSSPCNAHVNPHAARQHDRSDLVSASNRATLLRTSIQRPATAAFSESTRQRTHGGTVLYSNS